MEKQDRLWRKLKGRYLRQVRKALARTRHPRRREILEEVEAHLDRRYADLDPCERTTEGLVALLDQMGPPAEFAELLEPLPAAGAGARWSRLKYLCSAGLAGVTVLAVILVAVALSQERVAYVVGFKAVAPFHPTTPTELLAAFNERCPAGVPTHHFRTTVEGAEFLGLICVDTESARDQLVQVLKQPDKVELVSVRGVNEEEFRAHCALGQPALGSSGNTPTYIVTFQAVPPFAPATARELLAAFNANHPRGVRTHHYRTQVQEGRLVGRICVDTEAGRDAVVAMLDAHGRLQLVRVEPADEPRLEALYRLGQPGLKDGSGTNSPQRAAPSRARREPSAQGPTLSRTGRWPPGECSLAGSVFRRAAFSRIDHGAVRLTCGEYGSWTVEVENGGRFFFEGLPPGTYTLQAVDTAGYKDAYFNPHKTVDQPPTFELTPERRVSAQIEVEPFRPYRQITGTIFDEDGKPVTTESALGVDAWVQCRRGRWKGHFQRLASSAVARDGSYALDTLDGRPVYLQVRDSRQPTEEHPYPPCFYPGTFCRAEAKLVTFDDTDVLRGVDITLRRTGGLVLEGMVTEGDHGTPVSEALVSIFHYDMPFDLFCTYTDEQGRYRLDGLGAGTFLVHVDAVHKGYTKTRKLVTLGPEIPRLDFALNRGVDVRGVFVDEKYRPRVVRGGLGHASNQKSAFGGAASNFRYGNRFAPAYLREASTVIYEEGQGDAAGAMMVFPDETSFLLPAMAPGEIEINFHPGGRSERVQAMLYEGKDIGRTGLTVKPGQEIRGIQIVIATGGSE